MRTVLMVVSAADHWTLRDGTRHPTGYWAEELVEPHRLFTEAGWQVTVATPGGVAPTVDRLSLGPLAGSPWRTRRHRRYLAAHADTLAHPRVLAEMNPDDFDLVFYPGGHGPMEDLAVDPVSGALLTRRLRSGRPLALLCHAPAALLAAGDEDGSWPFAGYLMTALSNREELFNRFARKAPWLLEDRLVERGARYVKGRFPLRPHVTVDRSLYTGQNPASSARLARHLIADLAEHPALAVTVTHTVPASPARVYALISDITRMGEWSPETYAAGWIEPGRRFRGRNRIGRLYRWSMSATVTEATPGRAFAFTTDWPSSSSWRYQLEEVEGGTRITESMTRATPQMAIVRRFQDAVGVRDRAAHLRAGMTTTLHRIEAALRRETADPD
ncbi:SRPBCC family protein [Micromonospora maritima]|uniref:SRPBCC family protein n=1 Tax=Micromonospora maritima TaxID=986711 RepID=UPI00157C6B3E|nr:SRPBCC family protein [Micromonospora maritima]